MNFVLENTLKIKGINRATAEKIRTLLTLPNPAYQEAVKRGRWTGNLKPELRFYEEMGEDLVCPRGAAKGIYCLCRQRGEKIEIIDRRRNLEPVEFTFNGTLRPYQQAALEDVMRRDDGVLEASTGSGKTIMALAIVAARRQPTLILVHTKELLNQWQDRIKQFLGVEAGQVGGGKCDLKTITVGTVQTVRKHLDSLYKYFGFLIVDEAHRTPSTTFSECCEAFDAKFLLGLSATPYRNDGLTRLIYIYLGDRVHRMDPDHLRDIGAVLRPEIFTVETDFQYDYWDDYSMMISALTTNEKRNRLIVETLQNNLNGGAALVVSERVDHLGVLSDGLGKKDSATLTGKTPAKEREQIVKDLSQGKIKVLFSTLSLIGEGFDQAGLHDLYIVSPIKYHGRLTQVVGRILRPESGKLPRVFDFVDSQQPVLRAQARKRLIVYKNLT